ncbi:zinc ribbon domain-containing protein [Candidatus Micrarchaeota archaeon]|nr:zinc ribbon domain-containing protein [Candidatus Micrarchaeota archaeon]
MKKPKGPICQSCGMPMEKEEDFGTNADGEIVEDYCSFCFNNGRFSDENMTMEEMIEIVAGHISREMNVPEEKAEKMAKELIPTLKRWSGKEHE